VKGTACVTTTGDAGSGTCEALPGPGKPCVLALGTNTNAYCASDAYCEYSGDNFSTAAGTCRAPAKLGDACGPVGNGSATNVTCDATTTYCKNGKCAAFEAIDQPCTDYFACGPNADCRYTAPDVGTCRPRAAVGEQCGSLPYGDAGNQNYVACATGDCTFVDDCATANTSCRELLECEQGRCEIIDYAECRPRDAGTD
jgi:hypothetical protein